MGIELDDISGEFNGQGHRSKAMFSNVKHVIFIVLDGLTCAYSLCLMMSHDINIQGGLNRVKPI